MVNVLIVANNLNPVDGGISTFIMNEFKFIDRSKVHIDFVIHSPQIKSVVQYVEDNGSKVYQVSPYNFVKYRKFWMEFLKIHPDYDIIHVHSFDPTILYLGMARKKGITTIVHSHTTNMPKFDIIDRICRLNQFGSRFVADYFFGCSHRAIYERFGKKVANSNKSMMIPNGINTELFRFRNIARMKLRRDLNVENKLVIGNVGRFEYQKNQLFTLDVFECFHKKNPDSVLVLVGDGVDKNKIQNKIDELHLNDVVILTGTQKNIPDYLSAFDIFLFPSHYEGLSIALVEAQCSGLPCFVSSEAVDYESDMGCNLLKIRSLSDSPEKWALSLYEYVIPPAEDRFKYAVLVRKHGFDMNDSIKVLEDFYVEHSRDNHI